MKHNRPPTHHFLVFLAFTEQFSNAEIRRNVSTKKLASLVYPCDGALLTAVHTKDTSLVNLLLELGADVNDVYLLRSWYCTKDIARSLLRAGAPGIGILLDNATTDKACKEWDNDLFRMVFDSVPDEDVPGLDLNYLLIIAACSNRTVVVKLLLDRGAKVTSTAVCNAGMNGHHKLAEFLTEYCLLNNKE